MLMKISLVYFGSRIIILLHMNEEHVLKRMNFGVDLD